MYFFDIGCNAYVLFRKQNFAYVNKTLYIKLSRFPLGALILSGCCKSVSKFNIRAQTLDTELIRNINNTVIVITLSSLLKSVDTSISNICYFLSILFK